MEDIPVIIFCGGEGTRMRGGTLTKKELVEIDGRPIIWHVMRIFSAYGFNRFILPLGHEATQIKRYFLDYEAMSNDVTVRVGKRRRHVSFLGRDFFLTYGDGVSDVNIDELLAFHKKHGRLATITAIQPDHYQYGIMDGDDEGLVGRYEQYPRLPYWINGGFMIFERQALDYMRGGDNIALETGILQDMIADEQVMMYRHHGFWHSMDTLKDAIDLQDLWDSSAPWRVWD
jgi:glucose-1-phosphate cytidylyltransferase